MSAKKLGPFAQYVKKNFHDIKEAAAAAGRELSAPEVMKILGHNYRQENGLPTASGKKSGGKKGCTPQYKKACAARKVGGECRVSSSGRRSCRGAKKSPAKKSDA